MSGAKRSDYASRVIGRARELRNSSAFEPARHAGMSVGAAEAKADASREARSARGFAVALALLALLAAAFSLLLPYQGINAMGGSGAALYSPADVLDCYSLFFQMHVLPLFDQAAAVRAPLALSEFQAAHAGVSYSFAMNRVAATGIVVMCGVMLALSGLLFQTAFRNPLAAPTSLGVSDGVTLGCIVYASLGNASIAADPALYLVLVYGLGAVVVAAVLALSRGLTGGARYNVLDMLLLGTIVCQLLGGVNGFVQNFVMDYLTWYDFYEVAQAGDALLDPAIRWVAVVVFVVTLVPALVLRYRLNLVAFSDDEGRMMGARAGALRIGALVLGSAMQLVAIATIGQVAMLSIAVPFLVRYMMPADFRWQFLGCSLLGVVVLLLCFIAQHWLVFGPVTMPIGTVVSVLVIPFFVWMVAFGKGRW